MAAALKLVTPANSEAELYGLESEEMLSLVASALSRVFGPSTDEGGNNIYYLGRALREYAHVQIRRNGTTYPAPCPRVERSAPVASGATARKALGLTLEDLNDSWADVEGSEGVDAHLELEVCDGLLTSELWPVVQAIVLDGPGLATERTERFLRALTRQAPRQEANRRKLRQGVSQSTIDNHAKAISRLMAELCELHHRGHQSMDLLVQWSGVPKLQVPRVSSEASTDTTAPPLRVLRHAWQQLSSDVAERLRAPEVADEADAIAFLSLTDLYRKGHFFRLRDRALFALMICLGGRVGATSRLRREDYVRNHPLAGGGRGPVIRLNPRKGLARDVIRIKPIPLGLAALIDSYLALIEAIIGEPVRPEWPLFAKGPSNPESPRTKNAIQEWLGGKAASERRPDGKKAFLPIDEESDPTLGYTPHTLRSAATQIIRSNGGAEWLAARGLDNDPIQLVMIAECLTDHENSKFDSYGYAGAKKAQDRERMSALGSEIAWAMLTTDLGAEKDYDAEAYRAARLSQLALEAEIEKIRGELSKVFQATNGKRKSQDALDLLLRAQELESRKEHALEELRKTEQELSEIRLNPQRLIIVPDGSTAHERVDLDAIDRELTGNLPENDRPRLRSVREPAWLTPNELGEILEAKSTVRRWCAGQLPTSARKQPWDPKQPPIDESLGSKRRRILVSGLNPRLFDTEERRQKLHETLASWPDGWSPDLCDAPLVVDSAGATGYSRVIGPHRRIGRR